MKGREVNEAKRYFVPQKPIFSLNTTHYPPTHIEQILNENGPILVLRQTVSECM
jgi:hypothetical protein